MPILYTSSRCMHYLDKGKGEVIVLLHGLGSCAEDWSHQISALSDQFRIIAPDHRGHGSSNPSKRAYQMKDLARDVVSLMAQLRIEKYHVVGFSMGGMIAFELAVLKNNAIKSLTIINSAPYMPGSSWKIHLLVIFRLLLIRIFGMRKIGAVIAKKIFPLANQKTLQKTFENKMAQMDRRSYRLALKAIANFSVIDQLSRIKMPTLVISADQDYTPVDAKKEYVEKMPNAKLCVIKNSHHATPIDQPEQLNSVIKNFLHTLETFQQRIPTPTLD